MQIEDHNASPHLVPNTVSLLMRVKEPVIDMNAVREILRAELSQNKDITLCLNSSAQSIEQESPFVLTTTRGRYSSDFLVNASYGNLCWYNYTRAPKIELQYVEMVELESERTLPGLTLMDGPGCFGILPIGHSQRKYWWYSVAYSVHMRVETNSQTTFRPPFYSNWERMKAQGSEVFTFMQDLKYVRSHFTARAFWVGTHIDLTSARPSTITRVAPRFYQVLSGKLTTAPLIAGEIAEMIDRDLRMSQVTPQKLAG